MIDISNLTRYGFSCEWKPFPMSNPPQFGELTDGKFIKFEDVVELLKQAANSDYAAALKLYREFKKCFANPDMVAPFEAWCEERLHSEEPNVA